MSSRIFAHSTLALLCLLVGLLQCPELIAAQDHGIGHGEPEPPDFGEPADTSSYTRIVEVRTYPSLSVNIGISRGSISSEKLNDSYIKMESAFGLDRHQGFSSEKISPAFGIRLHMSDRLAAWWEYYMNIASGDEIQNVSVVSLSLMCSPVVTDRVSASLGLGIAYTRIQSCRGYQFKIPNSSGTLEDIEVGEIGKAGLPVTLLLEYHGRSMRRHIIYLSARYIFSPDASMMTCLYGLPESQSACVPVRLCTRSFWLTAGVAIGL